VESSRKPGVVIRKTMFDFSTLERWLEEAHDGLHRFAQRRNEPGNGPRRNQRNRHPERSETVGLSCSPTRRQDEDGRGDEVCVFANAAGTGLYKAIFGLRQPRGPSSSQMKLTFYARECFVSVWLLVFLFGHGLCFAYCTVHVVDPSKNDQASSYRDDRGQIIDRRYVFPVLARVFQVRARKTIECVIHKWKLRYTCPS
jgi:hypothetical protein